MHRKVSFVIAWSIPPGLRLALTVVFFCSLLATSKGLAQIASHEMFLSGSAAPILNDGVELKKFAQRHASQNLFLFGAVHGSDGPQQIDFLLLKYLHTELGLRLYAPEVDQSVAFFLNQYLNSGDTSFLNLAMHFCYTRVPQDATTAYYDKWVALRNYNLSLPKSDRISTIGLDQPIDDEPRLIHLAYLLPPNGKLPSVLEEVRNFARPEWEKYPIIKSGKPILNAGKTFDEVFPSPKLKSLQGLLEAFQKDSAIILKAFGEHSAEAKQLLTYKKSTMGREREIYENFAQQALPLLRKGERIYGSWGYFHVLQATVNGATPFAAIIKANLFQDVRPISILGILDRSSCLNRPIIKWTQKQVFGDVTLKIGEYRGYSSSTKLDGQSLFERISGLKMLRNIVPEAQIVMADLIAKESPFQMGQYFIRFSRGTKRFLPDASKSTLDYIQAIILIRKSASSVPKFNVY